MPIGDITGEVCGTWECLHRADPPIVGHYAQWTCICQVCGVTSTISSRVWRRGDAICKTCHVKATDQTGTMHGLWMVESHPLKTDGWRSAKLHCRCTGKYCNGETRKVLPQSHFDHDNSPSCHTCILHTPKEDLTGKVFGRLTILRQVLKERLRNGRKYPRLAWICQCECGTAETKPIETSSLVDGKTTSCGCILHERYMGFVGAIPINWWLAMTRGTRQSESRRKRGIVLEITIEQAAALFEAQDGRCAYTGESLTFMDGKGKRDREKQTASLDRIDSRKSYTIDNVHWVHKVINIMKQGFPEFVFLDMSCKVADHVRSIIQKLDDAKSLHPGITTNGLIHHSIESA
jgi:hypothetical protein